MAIRFHRSLKLFGYYLLSRPAEYTFIAWAWASNTSALNWPILRGNQGWHAITRGVITACGQNNRARDTAAIVPRGHAGLYAFAASDFLSLYWGSNWLTML